jgi:hypothetical protein
MNPWQPTAAIGCRGGCHRMSLLDKGKRRIQTDFGSHRKMRRVCLAQASTLAGSSAIKPVFTTLDKRLRVQNPSAGSTRPTVLP